MANTASVSAVSPLVRNIIKFFYNQSLIPAGDETVQTTLR